MRTGRFANCASCPNGSAFPERGLKISSATSPRGDYGAGEVDALVKDRMAELLTLEPWEDETEPGAFTEFIVTLPRGWSGTNTGWRSQLSGCIHRAVLVHVHANKEAVP
jgi:hypothetical protein